MMYTDHTLKPLYNGHQYVGTDGKQYPPNQPKDEIAGLHLVKETERPSDPSLVVTGFFINDQYQQVWQTRAKNADELKSEVMQQIENLERQQTQRRIREAVLGNQASIDFISSLENQIVALRAQIE